MSQHDLTIDNQGFPAFRADLNNALQALGSTQSGTTAPSPTFANQLWYDTTNNQLKIRNEDNDAWITLLTLDQSADSVSQLATAIAVLSAGTAGAPALTTTGDTNTGIFFPAADTIAFAEGGAEAMRIDSSGNLGIGTTSPSNYGKLAVAGTIAAGTDQTDQVSLLGGSGTSRIDATGGNASVNLSLAAKGGGAIYLWNSGYGGTQLALINQYGIGLGANTPSSGTGITFPATQSASSNANTLDDYEEGSWTPNVYHSSSNNSSWSEKVGTYRKVGSIVHCWFQCDGGNSGTSGSDLTLGGLPFTPTTTPTKCSFGIWGANGITPNTGNIFNAGGTPLLYNGGNALTTQIGYVSGYFSYVAS